MAPPGQARLLGGALPPFVPAPRPFQVHPNPANIGGRPALSVPTSASATREETVMGSGGVPCLKRALGTDASAGANGVSTTATSSAPTSSASVTPDVLTHGMSVSALGWMSIIVGVVIFLLLLLWRLLYIRSRYRSFPDSQKPPLTASYMLRSYLVPGKGFSISFPGRKDPILSVQGAPQPPPTTISEDEENGFRMTHMGGNRGAAAVSRRGERSHERSSDRRHDSRNRRRRETTGHQIGEGGRRLGEGDQDDDISDGDGEEKDPKGGELPAYGGVDPTLPIYMDAVTLSLIESTRPVPPGADSTPTSASAVPLSVSAADAAPPLARPFVEGDRPSAAVGPAGSTPPRPPPRRSSTRPGTRGTARDSGASQTSLATTEGSPQPRTRPSGSDSVGETNGDGTTAEGDAPGPFIPRKSSLNHLIVLGAPSRNNSLRRPARPDTPSSLNTGADLESEGDDEFQERGRPRSPIMGGFPDPEAPPSDDATRYDDVAAYEAATRSGR